MAKKPGTIIEGIVGTPRAWITGVKYRALAWTVAIVLGTVATIALAGAPWVPVVGVAVAAAWMSVSKITTRLLAPTCMACGQDLSGEPIGTHGIACPGCGSVQSPTYVDLARLDAPPAVGDEDEIETSDRA